MNGGSWWFEGLVFFGISMFSIVIVVALFINWLFLIRFSLDCRFCVLFGRFVSIAVMICDGRGPILKCFAFRTFYILYYKSIYMHAGNIIYKKLSIITIILNFISFNNLTLFVLPPIFAIFLSYSNLSISPISIFNISDYDCFLSTLSIVCVLLESINHSQCQMLDVFGNLKVLSNLWNFFIDWFYFISSFIEPICWRLSGMYKGRIIWLVFIFIIFTIR